jgi:predicted nucleic acid-binding protein
MLHSLALWARLPEYLQEGRMGAAKCIALALEEKCDDLVGTVG